jgi:ATP-dependent RNA helicase DDX56/DBP9
LDFRNVSFVVNVNFPPSARSYAHRVGRTARGGAKGVALSLVENESAEQYDTLLAVQEDQPKIPVTGATTETLQSSIDTPMDGAASGEVYEQAQPSPLDFDLREIEGFRYRVDDVSRAVTKSAVKEARAAELRAEILNSERLQSHFEDNPSDLQLLSHDRLATHVTRIQDHLK